MLAKAFQYGFASCIMENPIFQNTIAQQGRISYRSASRGYSIDWSPDLIGWIVVRRRWFGLGNKRGGSKMHIVPTLEDARQLMLGLHAKRLRRGYEVRLENDWLKSKAQKAVLRAAEDAVRDMPPLATEIEADDRSRLFFGN